MLRRYLLAGVLASLLAGCAMREEVKRIEQVKRAQNEKQASMSTDLTGEQVFFRSCNTCHPGGKKSPLGPALDHLADHFPTDGALAKFLRQGKGIMPPQPRDVLNDQEMDSLIAYLRALAE